MWNIIPSDATITSPSPSATRESSSTKPKRPWPRGGGGARPGRSGADEEEVVLKGDVGGEGRSGSGHGRGGEEWAGAGTGLRGGPQARRHRRCGSRRWSASCKKGADLCAKDTWFMLHHSQFLRLVSLQIGERFRELNTCWLG